MTAIPDIVSEAWEKREPVAVLATTGSDGAPNVIYVSLVGRFDRSTFFIANSAFHKTRQNILAGSKASLLFITRDRKAYQIKGTITLETSGAVFEEMQKIALPEYPAESAAVLRAEEVYSGADRLA